ncbi:hypothetical protein SUGI_0779230 [Cryptomeria japonica]|nr:hypothetical protein SUGI_0779230 [Cryptomeria japonica]
MYPFLSLRTSIKLVFSLIFASPMASLKAENSSSYIPERSLNRWNNDFVQSLETPYGGSEYRERGETLVKEVKILLKEMLTGLDGDLMEQLEMVDALQCLGIDRYFQAEIKEALDYVYGFVKFVFYQLD